MKATRSTPRLRVWGRNGATLAARTIRDSLDDRLPGLSAEVAFYLVLSLPPLMLVVLGILSYVGELAGAGTVSAISDFIVDGAANVFSAETISDTIEPAVNDLLAEGRADVLTLGVVVAVWSGSRAIRVIVRAVSIAYDMEDRRNWVRQAALGLALTLGGIVAIVVLLPLLVVGPRFGAGLADRYGLEAVFDTVWSVLYWPVVVAVGLVLLTWLYHIIPPVWTPWRRDLPGAVLALVVWILGSIGLRLYAVAVVETNSAFSLFAAPMVLLLWLYITALALLVGAELNAEVDKMWPAPARDRRRWRWPRPPGRSAPAAPEPAPEDATAAGGSASGAGEDAEPAP